MSLLEKQIIVGGERVDYLYNPSILSVTDTSNNAIEDVAEVAELLKNDSSGASKWVTKDFGFVDSNGEVVTGVRYGSQVTNETAGSVDADFVVATSNAGSLSEAFRIKGDKTQVVNVSKSNSVQRSVKTFHLTGVSTTLTPVEMFINGVENARMVVPLESFWAYEILITGRKRSAAGFFIAQKISGVVERPTDPDGVFDGGNAQEVLELTVIPSGWVVEAVLSTENYALQINVNGDTGEHIEWLAEVKVLETINP